MSDDRISFIQIQANTGFMPVAEKGGSGYDWIVRKYMMINNLKIG